MVDGDPRLCLAGAWIAINLGRPDDAAAGLAAVERALGGRRSTPRSRPAGPPPARSSACWPATRGRPWSWAGRRARCPPSRGHGSGGGRSLALGIALHACGELDPAAPVLEEAVDAGRRSRAWAPALVASAIWPTTTCAGATSSSAERRAREALRLAEEERHAEFPHAAGGHTVLAQVLAARGDLDEAWREAAAGHRAGPARPGAHRDRFSVLAQGEVALARDDAESAARRRPRRAGPAGLAPRTRGTWPSACWPWRRPCRAPPRARPAGRAS